MKRDNLIFRVVRVWHIAIDTGSAYISLFSIVSNVSSDVIYERIYLIPWWDAPGTDSVSRIHTLLYKGCRRVNEENNNHVFRGDKYR